MKLYCAWSRFCRTGTGALYLNFIIVIILMSFRGGDNSDGRERDQKTWHNTDAGSITRLLDTAREFSPISPTA